MACRPAGDAGGARMDLRCADSSCARRRPWSDRVPDVQLIALLLMLVGNIRASSPAETPRFTSARTSVRRWRGWTNAGGDELVLTTSKGRTPAAGCWRQWGRRVYVGHGSRRRISATSSTRWSVSTTLTRRRVAARVLDGIGARLIWYDACARIGARGSADARILRRAHVGRRDGLPRRSRRWRGLAGGRPRSRSVCRAGRQRDSCRPSGEKRSAKCAVRVERSQPCPTRHPAEDDRVDRLPTASTSPLALYATSSGCASASASGRRDNLARFHVHLHRAVEDAVVRRAHPVRTLPLTSPPCSRVASRPPRIPQADDPLAARCQDGSVRRECDALPGRAERKLSLLVSGDRVPHAHDAIRASRGDPRAVRRECEAQRGGVVPLKRGDCSPLSTSQTVIAQAPTASSAPSGERPRCAPARFAPPASRSILSVSGRRAPRGCSPVPARR